MKTILRNGALVLGLIAGATFMTSPTLANSVHKEGQFGGILSKIEPSSGYYERTRHAGRVGPLYSDRYYRGPHRDDIPRYAYNTPYGGFSYYGRGPGAGFGISVY